jgi:hypothetical protein
MDSPMAQWLMSSKNLLTPVGMVRVLVGVSKAESMGLISNSSIVLFHEFFSHRLPLIGTKIPGRN